MKNLRLTISFIFIGVLLLTMTAFVLHSKAQSANSSNPYDSGTLSVNDVITAYHNNINDAFNRYIKLMMTNITANPDDPNGKPFRADGAALTVSDCFAHPENYSTFCVSANLLGANSDDCPSVTSSTGTLSDGMDSFCRLSGDALPLKGYLNFVAALNKRGQNLFDTQKAASDWQKTGQNVLNSATAITDLISRQTSTNLAMDTAKKALDQTLSAYDQLRVAWPLHVKYMSVYHDLQTYRDKIVDVRHQTDLFPSKFIDLTTTACL